VIPVIAIGFALLGGLLLWFVIGSRGPWWIKLPTIVATSLFTFVVWHALDSFSGWPTAQGPPPRALMLGSSVDEPRAIYVWLLAPSAPGPLEYRPDGGEPRAYRLPYSRELHEQVDRASKLASKGQPVELKAVQGDTRGRNARFVVRRYQLPATSLPRKNSDIADVSQR
jgi:hypothetical protein